VTTSVDPGVGVPTVGPPATPAHERKTAKLFPLLRTLFAYRRAKVLGVVLVVVSLLGIVGSMFAPYDPNEQDLRNGFASPSGAHWLGTDFLGRDLFSLLLYGIKLTMLAGFQAVLVGVAIGVPLGLFAGYTQGRFAAVANSLSDTLLSMPPLIFALAVIGIWGPGLTNAMIAIGILTSPRLFRVSRAAASHVSGMTYIESAKSIGCSTPRIMMRHILTNSLGPILVQVTFALGLAMVTEASLSFLGLGAQPPDSSLGSMVKDGFVRIRDSAWPMIPPSIMIAVIVYVATSLGDAMQDAFAKGGEK
jgi:peptide/nickel transport system permease protein